MSTVNSSPSTNSSTKLKWLKLVSFARINASFISLRERPFSKIVIPLELAATSGLQMSFIFDTGASDITISQTEAQFLAKQGLLTQQDVIGKQQYQIADGSFSEGTIIRLKELTIGDRTINNVKASVIESQNAPLLLGQTALSEFGKVSLDYKNGYIIFE